MVSAASTNWIKLCSVQVENDGDSSQEIIQEKIFKVFRDSVEPGRYTVRDSQWNKKTFVTIKYTKCPEACAKLWRVRVLKSNLEMSKIPFDIEVTDAQCLHQFDLATDIPRPLKLKGLARKEVHKQMMTKSNLQIKAAFISEGSTGQIEAGFSQVPCDNALRRVRREIMEESDLDKDDLTDVFLRSRGPLNGFIRHLDVVQFCAYLMKDVQITVFLKWYQNSNFRRAFIDATGSIVRPLVKGEPILHHVLLIPIQVADDNNSTLFNFAEMITKSQCTSTIAHFLEFVIGTLNKETKMSQIFHEIVTDKSFANIGAILRAFNGMTLTDYLHKCSEIALQPNKASQKKMLRGVTVVRLCSSHTCKTMRDLVREYFKDNATAELICELIGHMFNITDFNMLIQYCTNFLFAMLSPIAGAKMKAAGAENVDIVRATLGLDLFKQDDESPGEPSRQHYSDLIYDQIQHSAIYKNSFVYKRLEGSINEFSFDTTGTKNSFHSSGFALKFLKCHLAYVLLWGNIMSAIRNPGAPRANNGFIESSFKVKKRIARENKFTIGEFGKVKIGRYLQCCSETVDTQSKKILLNIPAKAGYKMKTRKLQPDNETEDDVVVATEMYQKRCHNVTQRRGVFFSQRSMSQPEKMNSSTATCSLRKSMSSGSLQLSSDNLE